MGCRLITQAVNIVGSNPTLHTKENIWKLPNNKHTWAFYYFCIRKGDKMTVIKQTKDLVVLKQVINNNNNNNN